MDLVIRWHLNNGLFVRLSDLGLLSDYQTFSLVFKDEIH